MLEQTGAAKSVEHFRRVGGIVGSHSGLKCTLDAPSRRVGPA